MKKSIMYMFPFNQQRYYVLRSLGKTKFKGCLSKRKLIFIIEKNNKLKKVNKFK